MIWCRQCCPHCQQTSPKTIQASNYGKFFEIRNVFEVLLCLSVCLLACLLACSPQCSTNLSPTIPLTTAILYCDFNWLSLPISSSSTSMGNTIILMSVQKTCIRRNHHRTPNKITSKVEIVCCWYAHLKQFCFAWNIQTSHFTNWMFGIMVSNRKWCQPQFQ